ncbi:MAG: mycothiol synthase [Gordonia sp. (in: high G+C Gram-positive bacteria)]
MVTAHLDTSGIDHARRLIAAASAADGVAPLSEQSVRAIADSADDPDAVLHVVSPAGYANILRGRDGEPAMIEAVVDPAARRRGYGRALLESAFTAARALPGAVENPPRAWAHGDLPAARALASAIGVRPRRELLQLRREVGADGADLAPLDDTAPGAVVRTYASASDDAEILRVNNAAFAWHPEQGGWDLAQIRERVESDWFDPAGLFLAFDAADPTRLLGFHWTKRHSADLGEVYIVGVDPAAQGRGLGHTLTLAGLHYFAERGVGTVMLYVEGDNSSALRTYDRLGFTRYAVDVAYG